jgi:hypothetical protein
MRRKKQRHEWLWAMKVRDLDDQYWIIANQGIGSAQKKADKFLARLAKKHNRGPFAIKSLESRGTIDVF